MELKKRLAQLHHLHPNPARSGSEQQPLERQREQLKEAGFRRRRCGDQEYWLRFQRMALPANPHPPANGVDEGLRSVGQRIMDVDRWQLSERYLAFIDTETTGLRPGSGNLAFLLGVSFHRRGKWHSYQFFLHQYASERVMLRKFWQLVSVFKTVVSYNGRSFDLPLLKSRLRMAEAPEIDLDAIPHLDLMPIARRMYKGLPSRFRLQDLEKNILGFARPHDLPGAQIPAVYFAFQSRGEASQIAQVAEHHYQDMLTLFLLFRRMVSDLSAKESLPLLRNLVILSVKIRDHSLGAQLLAEGRDQRVMADLLWGEVSRQKELADALVAIFRRNGQFEKSVQIWRTLAPKIPEYYWRLSLFCERSRRDYSAAITFLESWYARMRLELDKQALHRYQQRKGRLLRRLSYEE